MNYGSHYWRRKRREYILKWGARRWNLYLLARRQRRFKRTPKGRYAQHREHARQRGIEWRFTFESWWRKWQRSGKWEKRGNKKGEYIMARIADRGPYSDENTIIVRSETNAYAVGISSGYFPRSSSSSYSSEVSAIL